MSVVGWAIVLSLPVYAAIQIVALLALGRRFELDADAPLPDSWPGENQPAIRRGQCRTCGAENNPRYTFCGRCVSRLPIS